MTLPELDRLALRILLEEPVTDFAPDILPCRGCEAGLGHPQRAGSYVWDLHGGQGFEECTAPTRAMIRHWLAKRKVQEWHRRVVSKTARSEQRAQPPASDPGTHGEDR